MNDINVKSLGDKTAHAPEGFMGEVTKCISDCQLNCILQALYYPGAVGFNSLTCLVWWALYNNEVQSNLQEFYDIFQSQTLMNPIKHQSLCLNESYLK